MAITDETYVLLTTFRKNGDGVGTPVWIVELPDGSCGFTTEIDSGKVKRIRNNPSVTLQACSARGKVKSGSALVHASAEVLEGDDAVVVRDAIRRKHPVMTRLIRGAERVQRLFSKREPVQGAIRMRLQ